LSDLAATHHHPSPSPFPIVRLPHKLISITSLILLQTPDLSLKYHHNQYDQQSPPSQSVDEFIVRTECCSCADNRLSLPLATDPASTFELSLVGKIISPRNFLLFVVQEIAKKAWKPSHPIKVSMVDRNTFLFAFGHEVDRHLAFNRRPWTFKGAHLVLKTCSPKLSWRELDFSSSTFWVQVHGLPLLWRMKDNIVRIGQKIGYVHEVDFISDHNPHWRKFVRARVEINISKPLKPGIFLPRPGLNDVWIGLKYEKLSDLCHKCGTIGHTKKDCNHVKLLISNQYGFRFSAYGAWIRTENDMEPLDIYSKPPEFFTPRMVAAPPGCLVVQTEDPPSLTVGTTKVVSGDTGQSSKATDVHEEISSFAKLLASTLH
jgi:hypothetical protein